MIVMTAVNIADLKARLSQHLRNVRRGRTIVVLDRLTPVARIIPAEPEGIDVMVTPPAEDAPSLARVRLPKAVRSAPDAVAVLLRDRRRRG
jgi:prevent-host-death family protein